MSIVELFTQIRHLKQVEADKDEKFQPVDGISWYYVFAAMAVFVVLLYLFGFILSNVVFLFVTPFIIGMKENEGFSKWKTYLIYSIVVTAILYLCFTQIFVIRLPGGLLLSTITGR